MSADPLRIAVSGALGRMGERVRALVAEDPELKLAAALESPEHPDLGASVAPGVVLGCDPKAALERAQVVIDFSLPAASVALVEAAAAAGVPCVVGTTGLDEAQRERVRTAAARIPIVWAPNFSVAVNVLIHLTREAARRLGPAYDAEIVELHHAAKRDAPSGTALRLAEAIRQGRDGSEQTPLVLSRAGETGPRPASAVGIQALRGGDCPGEHTVLFLGRGERIELIHRAASRDHFARGAILAARWVVGRPPGLYTMEQVLGLESR